MRERRILCFGDSFVAGIGDPQGLGWVGRAVARAVADGVPAHAVNLGVGGATSRDVLGWWLPRSLLHVSEEDDMRLVVSFGANDAIEGRIAPEVSASALGSILDGAAERRLGVFVVGPGPVGEGSDDARVLALDDRFAALTARRGVPYVPVARALLADATWTKEARRGDGAHPGAGGYDVMTNLVLAGGFVDWLRQERD